MNNQLRVFGKKGFFLFLFVLLSFFFPIHGHGHLKGDVDGDDKINLTEAIYALQVMSGVRQPLHNLEGYWSGILPDGDFDDERDEFPSHHIFLDITSQGDGALSGHLHRQVGVTQSDTPLIGSIEGEDFQLSAELDGGAITFSGHLASMVQDYEGEHFVADFTFPGGQSGTIVFESVDSHIQSYTQVMMEGANGSTPLDLDLGLASLTKDGGSGHPVILVHGLLSSPGAWDSMVKKLRDEGYFNDYEFWRFGYDTRQPFEAIGPEFYKLAGDVGLRDRAPTLVAHSMGGLVSRSYIALGGTFTTLVTLGTPHCGTPAGAGGIFTGPGTLEMLPCSDPLVALFAQEVVFNDFPNFAVVSGKITGGWRWVKVHKCGTVCVLSHCYTQCVDVDAYLWQFDRAYNTALKAGWAFVKASGYGDNDGAVPTSSANFCVGPLDAWPCIICPSINYENNKHLTNYDHFMLLEPSIAPDVYRFVVKHL